MFSLQCFSVFREILEVRYSANRVLCGSRLESPASGRVWAAPNKVSQRCIHVSLSSTRGSRRTWKEPPLASWPFRPTAQTAASHALAHFSSHATLILSFSSWRLSHTYSHFKLTHTHVQQGTGNREVCERECQRENAPWNSERLEKGQNAKKKKAFEKLKLMSESPKSPCCVFRDQSASTGNITTSLWGEIIFYCNQHTHFKSVTVLKWM